MCVYLKYSVHRVFYNIPNLNICDVINTGMQLTKLLTAYYYLLKLIFLEKRNCEEPIFLYICFCYIAIKYVCGKILNLRRDLWERKYQDYSALVIYQWAQKIMYVAAYNQRGRMTVIKKTVTMGTKSFSMPHFSFYLTINEMKLIFQSIHN